MFTLKCPVNKYQHLHSATLHLGKKHSHHIYKNSTNIHICSYNLTTFKQVHSLLTNVRPCTIWLTALWRFIDFGRFQTVDSPLTERHYVKGRQQQGKVRHLNTGFSWRSNVLAEMCTDWPVLVFCMGVFPIRRNPIRRN